MNISESDLNNPKDITLYPNSKPVLVVGELSSRLLARLESVRPQVIQGVRVEDIIFNIIAEIGYPGMMRMALNIIYSYTEQGLPYEEFIKPYKMADIRLHR